MTYWIAPLFRIVDSQFRFDVVGSSTRFRESPGARVACHFFVRIFNLNFESVTGVLRFSGEEVLLTTDRRLRNYGVYQHFLV